MVEEAIDILNGGDSDLKDFGKLLHESWMIKRSLTDKISNHQIDEIYEAAINAGALGGKLLGAGGGGFILFFAEPEFQPKIKEKLKNLLYVPFKFENLGSQIIYYAPQNNF
jgi:D-glycero-alpha-D-manno-heptose-7-phosphate kinase